jgi:hypothetical protein
MTDVHISRITFHDSTVRNLRQSGSKVIINLDDVSVVAEKSTNSHVSVLIVIVGVINITRNSVPVDVIYSEECDGEMLSIRQNHSEVTMTIQWVGYDPRKMYTATYDLIGGTMSFELI